jgi:RNA polymerase sigma factor (sigma-70 family)
MSMSTRHIVGAFRRIRQLVAAPAAPSTSDAQLLQRFVSQRDESAFELLVWRHGPMVHGVCRRVLRDPHDADDAFQATLLVLARKAASICERDSVGGWLYRVAYRVALRARDGASRRARHERGVPELPAVAGPHSAGPDEELRGVLDEELNRLAEKHRAPVVLCYLEGLTNEEAARQLRCPVGTVKTRLAQARRLLGQQLARRGLAPAALPLLAAAPPAALVGAIVRAAVGRGSAGAVSAHVACLTEGVLRAMMVTKLKLTAVAVAVGLAVAGTGTASYCALAGEPAAEDRNGARSAPPKPTPAEARVNRLKKQIGNLTKQIGDLAQELRHAEEDAARERAVPPRKKPVAVIFGNVPITRDELADHLLSRLTARELETFINRRILEHACQKEGITVTDAEVTDHLKAELKRGNLQEQAFRTRLREQHKTLHQWKADVLRPQLLLKKLAQKMRVTEKDLRQEYQTQYGRKVECRFLSWQANQKEAAECAARLLRTGRATFDDLARKHPRGAIPITITRQGTEARAALEKAAFALRPGEVSALLDIPGGFVLLECCRSIRADRTTRFEDVRESLKQEVAKRFEQRDTSKFFLKVKAEARVQLLWKPPEDNDRGEP